jgi:hypothetical protein
VIPDNNNNEDWLFRLDKFISSFKLTWIIIFSYFISRTFCLFSSCFHFLKRSKSFKNNDVFFTKAFFFHYRKIKKSDNQQQQQHQQQQQQQIPIIHENKENLLTRSNKQQQQQQQQQHYHRDNESGGFDYSSSVVSPSSNSKKKSCSPRTSSPITHDKNLSTLRANADQTSKIHVDVRQNPSDKLLLIYDSSEPSPRDLTDTALSSLPQHKVNILFSFYFISIQSKHHLF